MMTSKGKCAICGAEFERPAHNGRSIYCDDCRNRISSTYEARVKAHEMKRLPNCLICGAPNHSRKMLTCGDEHAQMLNGILSACRKTRNNKLSREYHKKKASPKEHYTPTKKPLCKIDQDAHDAKAAGLSYGQYMALKAQRRDDT